MSRLRNPTGSRDFNSDDIAIREYITNIAKKCFINYGAEPIDTPIYELYENVQNLYGEEFNKQVYKFRDDHDALILRYDLTVPFARYVGANGLLLFRRYQIGTVYRLDDPQIVKGRYRAFIQADFDIAGNDGSGIFDLEILQLANDLLYKLLNDQYVIRLNHRDILYQYLQKLNVSNDNLGTVCSSIDKLDKKSVDEICTELKQKNIQDTVIDNIKNFINDLTKYKDTNNIINTFNHLDYLNQKKLIGKEIYDLFSILLNQLNFLGLLDRILFDPLLARGLDYYTGIIFEAYYLDKNIMSSSICAGGRYDNLIGKFSNKGDIPAIGISLGVERIVTILENITSSKLKSETKIKVYVASIGKELLLERIKLCNILRQNNVSTMISHLKDPKMKSQYDDVFSKNIPYMIIIGPREILSNTIKIKNMNLRTEETFDREEGIKKIISDTNN